MSYKLLIDEKEDFYNDNSLIEIENEKIKEIIKEKKYILKDIYYNLDGQNIFKRVHRYRHKIIFL